MSKTLDQERILDSLKRQHRAAPSAAQAPPEARLPEARPAVVMQPDPVVAARPSPHAAPQAMPQPEDPQEIYRGLRRVLVQQTTQTPPVHRRYVLRVALLVVLLELAFIQAVRPPLAVPDVDRVLAWLSVRLPRPAAPSHPPQSMPRVIPAAVARPSVAPPSQDPAPAPPAVHEPLPEPSVETLPTASDVPRHRRLAMNPLAPRSTALEDTRKVLQLMESALQDATRAVLAAQPDTENSR